MRITIVLITLLAAGSTIAGCATSPRAQTAPEVYVSMLRVLPEENGQRNFGVTLLLRNPNAQPVELRNVDFSIRLGPAGFLEGQIAAPTLVPPLGDISVQTTVSSEFMTSVSSLVTFLQGPESALPYQVQGTMWLATLPPRDLRFARDGQVPLAMSAAP